MWFEFAAQHFFLGRDEFPQYVMTQAFFRCPAALKMNEC